MKKKSTATTIFKITGLLAFIIFLVGCKKEIIPPKDAQYDLNVFLNGEGKFQFPATVPAGPYTIRIRADGYEIFIDSIELTTENHHLLVKLKQLAPREQVSPESD